MTVITYSFL